MRAMSSFFRFLLLALWLLIPACATPADHETRRVGTVAQATTIAIGGGERALFGATPILGQTLLVPADTFLHEVTFNVDAKGTSFRTDVYAWDDIGKTITGAALASVVQAGTNGLTSYTLPVDKNVGNVSKIIAIVACDTCAATAYVDAQTAGYADGESYAPPDATLAGTWVVNGDVDLALSASFLTPTTMTVASDGPKVYGQTMTITATVGAGSGGTVTFTDDQGATLPSRTLAGDHTATITTAALAAGSHTITAAYDGGSSTQPNSAAVAVSVAQASTTTSTPASSANPSTVGQTITLSSMVTGQYGGSPTGTVTFFDGATSLGAAPVVNGIASLATSALTLGGHANVTAVYNGDGNFTASAASAPLSQTVSADTVTIAVVPSANPSTYGNDVVFTVTVSSQTAYSGAPNGMLHFSDGGTDLGNKTVDASGRATVTLTAPLGGTHVLAIHYFNDSSHADKDATYVQMVGAAATTVTLTDPTPKVFGETISFVATIGVPAAMLAVPTGTVTFNDGGTALGTATVAASGQATFSPTAPLTAGTHNIVAVYTPATGEKNYLGSTSAAKAEVVTPAATTTTVTTSSQPSVAGTTVTLTATIAVTLPGRATSPRGTVRFFDGGNALSGDVTVSGTTAKYDATLGTVGDHAITAVYSGTGNLNGSTGALTQKVVQLGSTVRTTSSSTNATSTYGDSVTFTVKVQSTQSPVPTGTVTVVDGTTGTTLGTATLAAGTATVATSALGGGTHTIIATYNGDTTYTRGATGSVVQTVDPAASSVGIVSSLNPSVFGQTVTFTATASSTVAGSRTGGVAFKDGLTTLQTVMLNAGNATYTTSALLAASHPITAVYAGDANYATSSSAALAQVVGRGNTTTSVVSSSTPSLIGTTVTFTATVIATAPSTGVPAGTVTFFRDGNTALGMATLDKDGFATFPTASLPSGSHAITATYGGSTNHNASTSGAFLQRVNTEAATISLAASPKPAPPHGQPVTFTATLTGKLDTPTGAMLFKEGPATLGAGLLASGVSSFATTVLSAGPHTIVAAYSGDQIYAVGTGAVALAVSKQTTTTAVSSSANPAAIGSAIALSAEVTSSSTGMTGQVQFLDADTSLGIAVMTGTTASLVVNGLAPGDHAITAVYGGDDNFTGSTANALVQSFRVLATDAGADGGLHGSSASADDGGCGCRATGSTPIGPVVPFGVAGVALAGMGLARRRRRR